MTLEVNGKYLIDFISVDSDKISIKKNGTYKCPYLFALTYKFNFFTASEV